MDNNLQLRLGKYETAVYETLNKLCSNYASEKIWSKDTSFWKDDPAVQKLILNRLGWLELGSIMEPRVRDLVDFSYQIKLEGFTDIMLLGMGGSSLCPEVLSTTFGSAKDFPRLHVLDCTDPQAILGFENEIHLETTLFIVSSKSGGTIEPNSFFKYFYEKVKAIKGLDTGKQFIAITDPGSSMEKTAEEFDFRQIFSSPEDVGGRYSALTYFGMVPGSLIGVRIGALLERAGEMASYCSRERNNESNPGLTLGAIMGTLGKLGRDKITFITSPELQSFGFWVEQLIAESTGKEKTGILPVEGELVGTPDVYGNDRLFIALQLEDSKGQKLDTQLAPLIEAGHPVVKITLNDTLDIGGQFFLWEYATAVCGAVMGINPFDEPNVKESKDNTSSLLNKVIETGETLKPAEGIIEAKSDNLKEKLSTFLRNTKPGDYMAVTAYIRRTKDTEEKLLAIRTELRRITKLATTTGYGPRFLHSTGQFHKGGPNTGVFIQLTQTNEPELPIPGEKFGFSALKKCQALGDIQALKAHDRRYIPLDVGSNINDGLDSLLAALKEITASN